MTQDEAVRIICPNLKCRTILSVPSNARGKSVRCRSCGTRVSVPAVRAAGVARAKPDNSNEAENSAA